MSGLKNKHIICGSGYKKYICTIIATLTIGCSAVHTAYASTLHITPAAEDLRVGDEFIASIYIDSPKAINAASINLSFEPEKLEVVSISTGSSIFKLWTKQASFDNKTGTLAFEGGLPSPGFSGNQGLIGTIQFKAKSEAVSSIGIEKNTSEVLLNDGLGTKDELRTKNIYIETKGAVPGRTPALPPTPEDTEPPSNLTIDIGKDPSIFNGKYFAAFYAEDNNGIGYYEIAELSKDGPLKYPEATDWRKATSPALLHNQDKVIRVFVKAVDTRGNATVESIEVNLGNNINWLVCILGAVALLALILYFVRVKKTKRIIATTTIQKY